MRSHKFGVETAACAQYVHLQEVRLQKKQRILLAPVQIPLAPVQISRQRTRANERRLLCTPLRAICRPGFCMCACAVEWREKQPYYQKTATVVASGKISISCITRRVPMLEP